MIAGVKDIIKNKMSRQLKLKLKRMKYLPINILCSLFPAEESIVFESNPDLACNSYAVFRYALMEQLNKKIKLIWLVRNIDAFQDCSKWENVEFIEKYPKTIRGKWKKYLTCYRAKVSICCNLPLPTYKVNRNQLNIYLDHGSPLKDITHGKYKYDLACGYYISQAPFFHKYILDSYDIKEDQIVCLGIPRNDQLFQKYNSIGKIIRKSVEFKKKIIWVPTFRTAEGGKRKDSSFVFPLGVPIIYSFEDLLELNTYLHKENTLLIIKPHPAQDLDVFLSTGLSNVVVITNEDILANDIQTNELLAQCDAMITDYSGIYYDFLLLDRPIAITLDDYKEYSETTGFLFKNFSDIVKGFYIYSYADFIRFINSVNNNIDEDYDQRKQIKELTNKYLDANSSKRVYEFVLEKTGW